MSVIPPLRFIGNHAGFAVDQAAAELDRATEYVERTVVVAGHAGELHELPGAHADLAASLVVEFRDESTVAEDQARVDNAVDGEPGGKAVEHDLALVDDARGGERAAADRREQRAGVDDDVAGNHDVAPAAQRHRAAEQTTAADHEVLLSQFEASAEEIERAGPGNRAGAEGAAVDGDAAPGFDRGGAADAQIVIDGQEQVGPEHAVRTNAGIATEIDHAAVEHDAAVACGQAGGDEFAIGHRDDTAGLEVDVLADDEACAVADVDEIRFCQDQ